MQKEERAATASRTAVIYGSLDEPGRARQHSRHQARCDELNERVGDSLCDRAEGHGDAHGSCRACARFRVVGLFQSGMYGFDRGSAGAMADGRAAVQPATEAVTGLRLAFADPLRDPASGERGLRSEAGLSRQRMDADHAKLLPATSRSPSRCVRFTCGMIVAVAAINIVDTLVMIVTEKPRPTSAILAAPSAPGPPNVLLNIRGCRGC